MIRNITETQQRDWDAVNTSLLRCFCLLFLNLIVRMWRVSLQLWTTSSPNLQPHKQAAVSVPVSFTELRPLASCSSLHLVCRSTETTARSKAAPENFVSMFSFLMNLYDALPLLCLHFWRLSKRIFLNWPFCGVLKGYRAFSPHTAQTRCAWITLREIF